MPYEIRHKSYNVCLIKYIKVKKFGRRFWIDLTIFSIGIISILIGFPVILVLIIALLAVIKTHKAEPHRLPAFEIELNRVENQVYVRSIDLRHKKPIIYSLSSFKGLESHEIQYRHKYNILSKAELFFKIEPIKGMVRNIPIQKSNYFVSPENAQYIVKTTNEWLSLADKEPTLKESPEAINSPEEPEVLRDFRDISDTMNK